MPCSTTPAFPIGDGWSCEISAPRVRWLNRGGDRRLNRALHTRSPARRPGRRSRTATPRDELPGGQPVEHATVKRQVTADMEVATEPQEQPKRGDRRRVPEVARAGDPGQSPAGPGALAVAAFEGGPGQPAPARGPEGGAMTSRRWSWLRRRLAGWRPALPAILPWSPSVLRWLQRAQGVGRLLRPGVIDPADQSVDQGCVSPRRNQIEGHGLPWPEIDGEPFQPEHRRRLGLVGRRDLNRHRPRDRRPPLVNTSCPGPFRTPGMLAVT